MKFCMLTTFFGSHSFGGDAAFVDRLSRALARHGHEVHVDPLPRRLRDLARRPDAPPVRAAPGRHDPPAREPRSASLSPLATHQTGRPFFKARAIRRLLGAIRPDVVHFHNLSLIGGPGLLDDPGAGRGQVHDDARTLARLPAARPLEVRRERLRDARVRPVLRQGEPAAAVLAEDRR